MINYSVCSIIVQLPDYQPGQPVTVKMSIPENAIPLQVDHQEPVPAPPGMKGLPAICMLHYLVPCDENGQALCEVCNERVADFDGVICSQCKKEMDEQNTIRETAPQVGEETKSDGGELS